VVSFYAKILEKLVSTDAGMATSMEACKKIAMLETQLGCNHFHFLVHSFHFITLNVERYPSLLPSLVMMNGNGGEKRPTVLI